MKSHESRHCIRYTPTPALFSDIRYERLATVSNSAAADKRKLDSRTSRGRNREMNMPVQPNVCIVFKISPEHLCGLHFKRWIANKSLMTSLHQVRFSPDGVGPSICLVGTTRCIGLHLPLFLPNQLFSLISSLKKVQASTPYKVDCIPGIEMRTTFQIFANLPLCSAYHGAVK
jgi:hypothetical protein